jgi:hypothetical protein
VNKVYDGTNLATVNLSDNRVAGDVLTTGYTSATFPDKNVGNGRTITVTGITLGNTDAGNYTFNTGTTTTANITPRTLTITATSPGKVYDATITAPITLLDDRVAGDVLTTGYTSATFPDKNVGTGRLITVSGITLGNTDSGNYSFNTSTTTTADITQRALTISATALNKIYDGSTTATPSLSDDRLAGDVLTLGFGAANFADKDAANGKLVTVTGLTLGNTDAGNYSFNTSTTTTANITKRGLIVTADPKSISYGTSVPAGTISYSGFITGENATFLGTQPTVSSALSGIQNAGTYAGNYTASGGVDGNYSFSYVAGDLTVLGKILNVTADTIAVEYGTAVPTGTLTYSGFITGQDASFLTVQPTVGSALSGQQAVGTYAGNYTPSGGVSGNYLFNYISGNLVVTRKNLNVSADNKSVNYGVAVPTGTLTYSGFIAGEDASFLSAQPTVSSGLSGIQNAGTYTGNYTASGGVSNNYNFIYTPGTLTITPTGLNVTVGNRTVTYGVAVPVSTITYTGFVLGEDETFLTTAPTVSSAQTGIVGAGTYAGNYTASGGVSGNYSFNYVAGDLTVTPKALNVTVGNRSVTYGVAVPTSSLAYTGFIAGEDASFLTAAPSISSAQTGVVGAGTYTGNYTASGGVSNNYTFNYVAGDLTVTKKNLLVTANNQNITYGTAVPVGTLSYSGFITGENATFLTTQPTVISGLSGIQNAGSYVGNYTVSGGTSANYSFSYAGGNLTVSVAPLTITPNAVSRAYGAANSFNGFNAVGLQNSETVGSVTLTSNASVSGSGLWNVGSWVVTPSAATGGTFSPSNYAITYNTGAITITPRALLIGATGINRVYDGSTLATVTLNDNRVAGDALTRAYSTATFTDKHAGSGKTVTVSGITLGGADAGNYTFNTATTTSANITQRSLTISANALNKIYDGTTTASVTLADNRVSGDVLTTGYGTASFISKQVGTGKTVTVSGITLGGADSGNYSFNAGATALADITPRALTISAAGINKLFDGTATATVTLSDNRVAGDALTTGYAAANFPSSNVGTGLLVTVTGITLGGADSANYSFNTTALASANIEPSSYVPPPPVDPAMALPDTVVKVSQDPHTTVETPSDDGIYATPTANYVLVYLPASAPIDNKLDNRPVPRAFGASSSVSAFNTPDEEKRLRKGKQRPRNLLAGRDKTFIYDANIPMPGHRGGFGASPDIKSI